MLFFVHSSKFYLSFDLVLLRLLSSAKAIIRFEDLRNCICLLAEIICCKLSGFHNERLLLFELRDPSGNKFEGKI